MSDKEKKWESAGEWWDRGPKPRAVDRPVDPVERTKLQVNDLAEAPKEKTKRREH